MDEIEFTINYLTKCYNQLIRKSHWVVTNEKNKIYSLVKSQIREKPVEPWDRVKLLLIRQSSAEVDYDGLVSSFKYIVDAIVDAGIMINDKYSTTGQWEVLWLKAPPKKGKIYVKVMKVDQK